MLMMLDRYISGSTMIELRAAANKKYQQQPPIRA